MDTPSLVQFAKCWPVSVAWVIAILVVGGIWQAVALGWL